MSNTLFVGKVYHRFDELPSTNDWAAKLVARIEDASSLNIENEPAKTKPPEGTVVRAANQTAGRGQLGSLWHSAPEENLLISIIFYPTWLEVQAQFYLSMAVALGLNDVIGSLGYSSLGHSSLGHSIKWPNDLYLGNKKTAGILIQNVLSGPSLQSSIVGIGLNVNQMNFPPELPHATSLALAGGQKLDLNLVAERLFECLERRYLQLKAGHLGAIQQEYEDQLWRLGEHSRFVRSSTDAEFEGIILGVTARGLLRLETVTGMEEFEVKQLRFVP